MARNSTGSHRRLAAIARRQHGLFTFEQALSCGFTPHYIRRRVREGVWSEIEPRVYRHALAGPVTWRARLMALVLVTRSAAAGRSAASLYGLLPQPKNHEVVVDHRAWSARHRRRGVRAVRDLDARDLVKVDGIPTTSVARTLIELGGVVSEELATDLVDAAIVRGLVTPRRLATRATALWSPRRRGCAVVLRVLASAHPELWRARNDWEARVLRHLRRIGAPDPVPNFPVVVCGRRRVIDFAWPDHKVALEFDGFVPHSSRRVFDDDRVRQNALTDADWRVYRVTATAIRRSARSALAPVVRALAR